MNVKRLLLMLLMLLLGLALVSCGGAADEPAEEPAG